MDGIRLRRELADLPEPRFLHVTPTWLRCVAATLAVLCVLIGGGLGYFSYLGYVASDIDWVIAATGLAALAAGGLVIVRVLFTDWRDWIDLAVTADGLYLPGRGKGVVFISWPEVAAISVVRRPVLEGRLSHLKLTLRLPEDRWKSFSRFARIKGENPLRSYTMSALTASGEELAAGIQAIRARGKSG